MLASRTPPPYLISDSKGPEDTTEDAGEDPIDVSLFSATKFYAVDSSGSTAGQIMRQQHEFVEAVLSETSNSLDLVSFWSLWTSDPTTPISSLQWQTGYGGGTDPTVILKSESILEAIHRSDVWFLLTDGYIDYYLVQELAQLAYTQGVLNIPVIFVITDYRRGSPNETNISVGISFVAMVRDALILFKDECTGTLYVISAKGCFDSLQRSDDKGDLSTWDNLVVFKDEREFRNQCEALNIKVPKCSSRPAFKGIGLGPEWEAMHEEPTFVDLDALLSAGKLPDDEIEKLFAEEAFNHLAVAYKTQSRITQLRSFVQSQKIEKPTPKIEDVAGASSIILQLENDELSSQQRQTLQERLREAHARNRKHYQESLADARSPENSATRKRNQLVDAALRSLSSIEASGFTAEILSRKSNRAKRAAGVNADASKASLSAVDFDGPAYRGFCQICCGDEEVMSISLKELDQERSSDNTTDFALNNPLAAGVKEANLNALSSQNLCFQCALHSMERLSGRSIYQEELTAIIPTVSYEGDNKQYIHDQLYLALTAGLKTGAAGVAQLLMAILDRALQTKTWAGCDLQDQTSEPTETDVIQRKQTFEWMLQQLLEHTRTRETFSETGEWVNFPTALGWVARDFKLNGLASYAITYPIAGYLELVSLGQRAGVLKKEDIVLMNISKIMYSLTATYLADLFENSNRSLEWKQKYLALLYEQFNGDLVPRDLGGPASIATNSEKFWQTVLNWVPKELFAGLDDTAKQRVVAKIQMLLFWLIYHQSAHVTAQNFIKHISDKEHLAKAVLDPTLPVPKASLQSLLLSIFVNPNEHIDPSLAQLHKEVPLFTSPFGPSVLHCAFKNCNVSFVPRNFVSNSKNFDLIRQARRDHLIESFGIKGRFEQNQTGLPEVTSSPEAPSCSHYNLHVEVARAWAALPAEAKHEVLKGHGSTYDVFITTVRVRVSSTKRGDVFSQKIESDIREVLPSFFQALRTALRIDGKDENDVTAYKHDFTKNTMEHKALYELGLTDG